MNHIRAKQEGNFESEAPILDNEVEQPLKTPSWFTQKPVSAHQDSPREKYDAEHVTSQPYIETPNAKAYETYKRRMEQRFREGQEIYDHPETRATPALSGPQPRRPTLPLRNIQGRKRLYLAEQQEHANQSGRGKSESFPWFRMVALGTIGIFVGGVGGLAFSNTDLIKQKFQTAIGVVQQNFATLAKPAPVVAVATRETVISKKPVATATLDVNDVKGTLGGMIPLMLSAQSADDSEPISLKISGLPQQAYLTAGVKSTTGSWTLKPSEIDGVKLVVPQSDAKQFDMEVAAVEDRTGALAAPIKAMNVQLQGTAAPVDMPITQASAGKANAEVANGALESPVVVKPVSAVPDTAVEKPNMPSAIPTALSEADDLVVKGNSLLQNGDIISARQFFLRASELGNAQGSFGVARSYDPKVFAKLNVVGLQPDAAQAADWYHKAADAGVVAAQQ